MRLLEREAELARLVAAVDQVRGGGQGAAYAVVGESGAGKSTLVQALVAQARGVRVLSGHCDPLHTPRPLGPFRDLPGLEELGRDERLPAELCDEVYAVLRTEPTLLVVEDLHWVDAASVEVLRFLARRVESVPLVLVLTYRGDEIGPRHPARPLLGDVAALDGVDAVPLRPLSVAAVAQLVEGTGLDAGRVHAVTGGNPFFVTEVVQEPELPMPMSVRDAVLARTAAISTEDFEVLQLVATAPDRLDDRLLPALGVDLPTLRRLDETALLSRTAHGISFRHELARQAVESTIPPGGAARLHARVIEGLERIAVGDPVVLTHHAVAAHDSTRAAAYAREAAAEAIRAGAHTEAAAFYEIALEHLPGAAPAERADLLLALSYQQYMTSRLREAIDHVRATFPLWREAGDEAGLAEAHAMVAVYEYYNARRRQAEEHLDKAATIAEATGSRLTWGHARTTRAYLAYMRSDDALATACLAQVRDVTADETEELLRLRERVVEDARRLASGDLDARARLFDDMEEARAAGFDELASTVFSNLANLDVEHGRYRQAESVLAQSLPFTVERDIPICRSWQTGVRTRLRFVEGHWSAALEDAAAVLDEQGMPLAAFWPHMVSGLVPLRRGEGTGSGPLEDAYALAQQLDEPLRRLAALAGLAEQSWMTGRPDPRVDGAPDVLSELGSVAGAEWAAGNLAAWLCRLGGPATPPGEVAEPFRLLLDGRYADAAAWWRLVGDQFNEAMALADSPDPQHRVRGVALLDQLGAVGTADRLRADLRRDGVAEVPRRPQSSTRANPGGLTNRQLDVARLVAQGLSNSEIAAKLYISPKTTDHHVSAILTKLDLPTRRAVMARADELGLV